MKILLVCAVEREALAIALSSRQAATVVIGVGPVEAAINTARALAAGSYDLVISAGVGGGFMPDADVGARVIVTSEHYIDLGREDTEPLVLPGGRQLVQQCEIDAALLTRLAPVAARFGPAVTSATITTSDARAEVLRSRVPGVVVEAMEGFAVLEACRYAGVPAIELRGISNRVGARASAAWDLERGLAASASLVHEVIALVS